MRNFKLNSLQRRISLSFWRRVIQRQLTLPALLVGLILLFTVSVESFPVAVLTQRNLLEQLLFSDIVLFGASLELLQVLRRQLLQLPGEVVQEEIIFFVQSALVSIHFYLALLFELQQGRLMLASHPLVARHLLVHVFLQMFLLLLRNDAGRTDGCKVVGTVLIESVDCRLGGVVVMTAAVHLLLLVQVLKFSRWPRLLLHHQLLRMMVVVVAIAHSGVRVHVLRLRVVRRNRRWDSMARRIPMQIALLLGTRLNGAARRILTAGNDAANRLHAVLRRDAIALAAVTADLVVGRVVGVANVALGLAVINHENLLHLSVV